MKQVILCCDLDRTVLPNGRQPESAHCRRIFKQVIEQCPITLVYVSGRDLQLLKRAIDEFDIPVPDYAIGDVGTSCYKIDKANWQHVTEWDQELEQDWHDADWNRLLALLANYPQLSLQEHDKQGKFKISFYAEPTVLTDEFTQRLEAHLAEAGFKTCVITSIDETTHTGLVDILPANASKYHAVEFLLGYLGFTIESTVFAGDSGNDLPVITSAIPSVLVNNAHADVKAQAARLLKDKGNEQACYFAQGSWLGLNGNYTAGILEGLAHYHPEFIARIKTIVSEIKDTKI